MSKGKLTILIGLILLLIGSFWLYSSGKKNKNSKYKVQYLERGNINATVTAAGSLSALKTVQVGSQVSGIISKLYVDFNSHVKKGELIAELDPTTFQAVVEQRRADLEKAKVDMRNMQTVFERDKKLFENQLLSHSEYDTAEANLYGARASVAQSVAALKQAETNLSYTKILSPIDGIVVDRQYDIGQTVAASFQAPTLFTIAQDLTRMQVSTSIDEADVGKIQPGQIATFIVDAYPDQVFHGNVSQIRLSTQVVQNVVTYPVLIDVQNDDLKLKPGMTANVTIPYETKANVLKIPNAALRFQPEPDDLETKSNASEGRGQNQGRGNRAGGDNQGKSHNWAGRGEKNGTGVKKGATVYVLNENQRLQPVAVRTSLTDGAYTALEQGNLKEGDPIVVGLMTSKAMDNRGGMIGGARRGGRF